MSLTRKFLLVILFTIFIVATINIVAFYAFYSNFLNIYLSEKIETKNSITIDYINKIIEKQTADEIDDIFSDPDIEFFELLENNNWNIPLNQKENRNIVVKYLDKSWISSKYIEELVPNDNLTKIIDNIKDRDSPEYKFIKNLTKWILITNLLTIIILSILIWYFAKKTILPIKEATRQIKKLKPWKENIIIEYEKKDEIWLLISAINWLNNKLNVQKTIRSRLLADISHELKTPITSISCYLEWITDWIIKLDKKNLSAITDEMNRLILLVNRIMNYEKFENQKLDINKKEHNISDIIKQVVETHKKRLKETRQRIKIVWDENLIIIFDENLLKQVLHNIIWNFLKYAWNWSILKINITKKYIDFFDNWNWIPQNETGYLTEKFYQWKKEKSWDAEKRWIWVWLSLVEKIIERHDWNYEIKSDIWKWFSFKIYF